MNYYDILLAKKLSGGGGGEIVTEALNVTANGQYTAPQGKAYTPVNVDVAGYKVGEVANLPQPIATFNDGTSNPLKSLTASIVPVQDLHGYDSPWAGGAGKNKLNLSTRASATIQGITSEVKADNTVVASGTSTGNGDIICPVETPFTMANGETYTISLSGTDIRDRILTIFIGTSYINIGSINSGEHKFTFTFTRDVLCNQVMFRASNGATVNINAKLQIEKGSTATSYAPYSNICPISGWTEEVITVADDTTSPTVEQTYTIPFTDGQGQSVEVFGGSVDVINGVVTPCPYYASYNGEQLTGEWISDRDVYSPNTTPTTGAQVVNIGATGTPFSVQPTSIKSLDGDNNVFASTGDVEELKYFEEL